MWPKSSAEPGCYGRMNRLLSSAYSHDSLDHHKSVMEGGWGSGLGEPGGGAGGGGRLNPVFVLVCWFALVSLVFSVKVIPAVMILH